MLIKKELLSIPLRPKPDGKWKQTYIPAAQIVELPRSGRILAVDYYTRKDLFARFFCDGRNYSVFDAKKGVWRKGYPTPDSGAYYCSNVERIAETDAVCNSFFPREQHSRWQTGVEEVNTFVYQKNSEKRDRERENRNALMKRHMEMFPPYPDNLQEYCSEQVFRNRYIFISARDRKGIRTAKCSHCGAKFSIDTAGIVSGTETTCPMCHTKATYRGMWIKSDVVDREDICICHKVDNQLLIQWAHVERTYAWPDFKQRYSFDDFAYSLYLVKNVQQHIYTYKYYKTPYAYDAEWHRLPLDCSCYSSSYVYTDNLRDVFGERIYNVDLQAGLAGKKLELQFVNLLDELKSNRKAEYLFKLGLPLLAACASRINGNPNGQGVFQKQVGINKQYLPMCREMNVDFGEYLLLRDTPQWITPEILQQYRDINAAYSEAFSTLFAQVGITRVIAYIQKQRKLHPKQSGKKLAIEYRDYLNMSHDLHVDLSHKSVLMPQDIREAHRIITERYNANKMEIEKERRAEEDRRFSSIVSALYETYHISDYSSEKFSIAYPMRRTDLIAEGQSLNHCVGLNMYANNHLQGEKMIFFIRKKDAPAKPYFTMELNMQTGRILQLYGFGDCSAPKAVRQFAEAFAKYTQRQINRRIV